MIQKRSRSLNTKANSIFYDIKIRLTMRNKKNFILPTIYLNQTKILRKNSKFRV